MRKAKKYGITGLAIGAVFKGLENTLVQRRRMQQIPGTDFNWGELLVEAGKGTVVVGLVGAGIGAYRDYQNSLEKPLNTDAMLFGMLLKVKLNPENKDYSALRKKAKIIIQLLKQRFHGLLKDEPIFMGSTERGTAVRRKFDIDIGLLFHHDSFSSTADMYNAVYSYIHSLIGSYGVVEVREQKKSVGIICKLGGKELKIDIVPCKVTRGRGRDKSGYLSVYEDSLWGVRSTYTKTDIHLLNAQKLSPTQQNLVVLLKEWKHRKQVPLPSHLLENLVLDAYQYNRGRIPRKLTDKLVIVFDYVGENLNRIVIRSVENTNNILTDISDVDKSAIINACKAAVDDFNYQKNSIVDTITK
jgi:hypothetical protein